MTAKGKITTANLEVGTRILIVRESDATAKLMERDAEMVPATKQTGATVARVLEVRAGTRRQYERNVPREVVTTAGVVRAYGHQTFILAPESPAAVKKAHVEALAMNEEFDAAKAEKDAADSAEQIMEWLTKYDIFLTDASTADCERVAKKYHDAIGQDFADALREDAARKAPEQGDTIERYRTGQFLRVVEVDAKHVTYHGFGKDLTVGIIDRTAFGILFRIVGSDAWRGRTGRCGNEWHRSAPARERMLCPECPA
jgi:hypothetical protein